MPGVKIHTTSETFFVEDASPEGLLKRMEQDMQLGLRQEVDTMGAVPYIRPSNILSFKAGPYTIYIRHVIALELCTE